MAEKEYIERNRLLEWAREFYPEEKVFASAVINAPAADVQEVRHGKWEKQQNGKEKCSECGCGVVFQIVYGRWEYENYCPYCGAKMDKE